MTRCYIAEIFLLMTKIYNGTRYYKYKVRNYIKSSLFRSSILYFGHDFCVLDKCVTLGGATGNPKPFWDFSK